MTTTIPSRRICLVLQSGIGDVVHGLPLVNALKRDDPAREITWVVQRVPAPLLAQHPSVADVILFDRRRGLREVLTLRQEMRKRRFDAVLNCGIYFKSAVPTFFARAPHKIGFGKDRAFDLVWLFANHHVPPQGPRHRQDMYLELAEYLAVAIAEPEWRLTFTEEERLRQAGFFEPFRGERVAGIVTTSAGPAKDWAVERYADLATALIRDFGFRVVLLGGPGSREIRRAGEVARRTEGEPIWALGDDLRRLAWLIEGCHLLIAPDTGPLHISRALATPVIGLYGHTNPRLSGPYRAYQDLVVDRYNFEETGVPYAGEVEKSHPARPGARQGRMELIAVSDVLEKVELALSRYDTAY